MVALSTTEAEYISLRSSTKESIYARRLINDTGLVPDVEIRTEVLTNYQGGMRIVGNELVSQHFKHIGV